MALTQLFFKKGNYLENIRLDVIIKESATASVRVTENPVENAANINDHVIVNPSMFTMDGVVSDISSTFTGAIPTAINTFTKNTKRSKEAWNALLELLTNKTVFSLVQNLRTYENVVLMSLSESQDKDTSNGLFFSSTLKEIIVVGAQTVTEDNFNDSNISDKMVPTTQGGLKQVEV